MPDLTLSELRQRQETELKRLQEIKSEFNTATEEGKLMLRKYMDTAEEEISRLTKDIESQKPNT